MKKVIFCELKSQRSTLSWYLVVRMLHLPLKFRLSENVSKRDAFLARVAKQRIVKDSASYRSQAERAKIAIH